MADRRTFGTAPDGLPVDLIALRGSGGAEMQVITYGCVIVSLRTPDRDARPANIVLGFDALERYVSDSPYYGAVIGRYANRIAEAQFSLDGRVHHLGANEPPHQLHGGFKGFDKQVWEAEVSDAGSGVVFRRRSPDGEEGYPGNLDAQVVYRLTDRNELCVEYQAETDAPTHVNLSQHSYFNLCGAGNGDVRDHRLLINADAYLPVTDRLIPTGEIAPLANTPFDFREPTAIGARADGRYDHNFVLNPGGEALALAARVHDPASGRTLEVRTTEPGIQLYVPWDHCGLSLETQHHPDSPNRPAFPSTLLLPGDRYRSQTTFAFGVE